MLCISWNIILIKFLIYRYVTLPVVLFHKPPSFYKSVTLSEDEDDDESYAIIHLGKTRKHCQV